MAGKLGLLAGGIAVVAVVAVGGYYLSMQGASGGGGSSAGKDFAYQATPGGITLQPLGAAQGYGPQRLVFSLRSEIVYSNDKGLTLYTYDKDVQGKSNCTGDCTKD